MFLDLKADSILALLLALSSYISTLLYYLDTQQESEVFAQALLPLPQEVAAIRLCLS